jgi:hypothetical protein
MRDHDPERKETSRPFPPTDPNFRIRILDLHAGVVARKTLSKPCLTLVDAGLCAVPACDVVKKPNAIRLRSQADLAQALTTNGPCDC